MSLKQTLILRYNDSEREWLLSQIQQKLYIKDSVIEQAKKMEKNNADNKAIHFAEWLTNKHTIILTTLYEEFEKEYYNETFKK
jgi:hypothetical protein